MRYTCDPVYSSQETCGVVTVKIPLAWLEKLSLSRSETWSQEWEGQAAHISSESAVASGSHTVVRKELRCAGVTAYLAGS